MCLDRFCAGICGGIPKTTNALTAEPRYMTFEAQTSLLNNYALLRLEHLAIWHRDVSNLELLIPKLYFEAKTPVFTAFLYRSTDQPIFFNVVEVSECFWTVLANQGRSCRYLYALNNHMTNRNRKISYK